MRLMLVIAGVILAIISIPAYYQLPHYISDAAHSFVSSMSNGNVNSVSMLRQMGYPSMHQVLTIFQYSMVGMEIAGIGLLLFGLVAKKSPKELSVKLITEEPLKELHIGGQISTKTKKTAQNSQQKVTYNAVSDVLGKLETELKDMKKGYEEHKQKIENDKKKLENRQREKLAKIIATGEVLIKEISPNRFEERIQYYVDLKNPETGQPIDLSLLAEKFAAMKKRMNSDKSDLNQNEFDDLKRFLD